ncbi:hypothetical protein [Cronobacter turicensis]|uniref:hypothetical protein n=1 Tax=Cronobacter turicensis TaxID=413502 RepID=UPI0024C31710|nr:hypothetical protein [Cronobacter turicensis]MDK1186244.1 hypothetical protein [Cronobacter turicensis]MDK1204614.1 hypothetical protein [Cronobacter turicensis]MDK1215408.1 hypothetical protein [Cronobacter turicensis]MDK1220912.1 hypothetical protein [Cronobacter turicensis]MDK1233327.1 hypothetical protein [Cronobacter turicensis]
MTRERQNVQMKKGTPFGIPLNWLAEAQRFELWNPFGSPVFKTEEKQIKINNLQQ